MQMLRTNGILDPSVITSADLMLDSPVNSAVSKIWFSSSDIWNKQK